MSALGVPPDVACVNAAMDAASESGDQVGALASMDLLRGLAPRASEASQGYEDSPQLDLKGLGLRPNEKSFSIAIKACRKVLFPFLSQSLPFVALNKYSHYYYYYFFSFLEYLNLT